MKVLSQSLVERDVSLRPFNTFGIDANAALFARVRSLEELQQVLADRSVAGGPLLVLAAAAMSFTQTSTAACEDKIEGLHREDDARDVSEVGAGEKWHAIVGGFDDDVPGLEPRVIPGSVRCRPIQNIGRTPSSLPSGSFEAAWEF